MESDCRPLYSFIFEGIFVGRMPLFICVSGYLFSYLFNERGKYKTLAGFIANKTKRLLLPCFLFTIISCLTFKQNVLYDFFFGGGHLWFLKMLYLCFIVCWLLGRYVKYNWQYVCLIIAAALMFLPGMKFFSIGQFTKYFVFFYLVFLLCKNREKLQPLLNTKKALYFHSLVYWGLCVTLGYLYCINQDIVSGDIIHLNKSVKYLLVLMRVYTIFFAFSLVNTFVSSKFQFSKFFDSINNCSYGIYLLHFYFLMCIQNYAFEYFRYLAYLPPFVGTILVFVVIFSLSYMLTHLFKKTRIGRYLL